MDAKMKAERKRTKNFRVIEHRDCAGLLRKEVYSDEFKTPEKQTDVFMLFLQYSGTPAQVDEYVRYAEGKAPKPQWLTVERIYFEKEKGQEMSIREDVDELKGIIRRCKEMVLTISSRVPESSGISYWVDACCEHLRDSITALDLIGDEIKDGSKGP